MIEELAAPQSHIQPNLRPVLVKRAAFVLPVADAIQQFENVPEWVDPAHIQQHAA